MPAFNGDAQLMELMAKAQPLLGSMVETGTYTGETTRWLAEHRPVVHTIEYDALYGIDGVGGVVQHRGSSLDILPKLLPTLPGPIGLFLDAHWGTITPTPNELAIVAELRIRPGMILIHDVRVDGDNRYGYDTYPDFDYTPINMILCLDRIYGKCNYLMKTPDPSRFFQGARGWLLAHPDWRFIS